ncbi:hypothetical protein EIP91_006520 [Steccherinum ochraceum]|uniref:Uncharacterized protein n=1 Tax=Steccherinum ochraceum TaxID=92696 RepID=A0A4R0R5T9_9APHY|nr:hypothetical protein EIP91_006520 [Steccherinum ochraceum]
MSLLLPVSSFPDVVSISHDPPMDQNVRIIVTPPSLKKRMPILGAFGKSLSRPSTPIPDAEPEPPDTAAVREVSTRSVNLGRCEVYGRGPVILQQSITPTYHAVYHDHHLRSNPGTVLRRRPSWMSVLPGPSAPPRSTKESIAILGLSRRSPSPDSSTSSDADSMVACCYSVESQALPPLPPISAASPPHPPPAIQTVTFHPPSRSSSLNQDAKEPFELIASDGLPVTDDEFNDQDLESISSSSSVPPSPITFSHRNSVYIAAGSSSGVVKSPQDVGMTTVSLTADSQLRWRATSASATAPSPSTQKRQLGVSTLSPEFAANLAVQPWSRATHFPTTGMFTPAPKLLKPGQSLPPQSPISPTSPTSSSKLSVKLQSLKIFRRRLSVSADEQLVASPADELPGGSQTPVSPPPQSENYQHFAWTAALRRKKRHRNSIHLSSISSLPDDLRPGSGRSSIGSGSDRTESTMHGSEGSHATTIRHLSERRSTNTLRSVTTHRVAGDTWREEDMENVIDTLRTMKVGKLR